MVPWPSRREKTEEAHIHHFAPGSVWPQYILTFSRMRRRVAIHVWYYVFQLSVFNWCAWHYLCCQLVCVCVWYYLSISVCVWYYLCFQLVCVVFQYSGNKVNFCFSMGSKFTIWCGGTHGHSTRTQQCAPNARQVSFPFLTWG